MIKQREEDSIAENFFISAIHQEIFNRVFPCIRHDLVGGVSASLMRVSIMERHLNKAEVPLDSLRQDLKKIELQLKDNINSIRALQFWDFDATHEDVPINVIKKSIHLMSSQLALKFIQINIQPQETHDIEQVKTKPLLYCLLCLWSYVEDNDFDNHHLDVDQTGNAIQIHFEARVAQDSIFKKDRNLIFSQALVSRFAKHYSIDIRFTENEITLAWP